MIQGSINQLIGLAAGAARLAPGYETRQEARKLQKQQEVLKEQEATITADDPTTGVKFSDLTGTEQHKEYADVLGEQANISEKLFKLTPSESTYKESRMAKGAAKGERAHYESEAKRLRKEQAEYEAQESLALEQERLRKAMRQKLMQNAPAAMTGKRGTIKYGNI